MEEPPRGRESDDHVQEEEEEQDKGGRGGGEAGRLTARKTVGVQT